MHAYKSYETIWNLNTSVNIRILVSLQRLKKELILQYNRIIFS